MTESRNGRDRKEREIVRFLEEDRFTSRQLDRERMLLFLYIILHIQKYPSDIHTR